MVFENLKAAFYEHLTHTSFISRKLGFSRRCRREPLISTGTGRLTPARNEGEPVFAEP